MARLYRPHIPLEVRCRVALRQLGSDPERIERRMLSEHHHSGGIGYAKFLAHLLGELARELGCEVKDLRLDHDPALCNRKQKVHWRGDDVLGLNRIVIYTPAANDPEHLLYRTHAAHDIKTRVRGEKGQFSDLALLRREKKRKKPSKRKQKMPSRPFPKIKRSFR